MEFLYACSRINAKQCLCLLRNHTVFFYHPDDEELSPGPRKLGNSTAKWMEQRKDADGDVSGN